MHRLDKERIREAIDAAENGTTGRIAVRILPHLGKHPVEYAKEQLQRASLHRHPERNSVLFLIAPQTRRFAVFGDDAIHRKLGDEYWTQLVGEMMERFKTGDPTDGLIYGIERIGAELQAHFPKQEAHR